MTTQTEALKRFLIKTSSMTSTDFDYWLTALRQAIAEAQKQDNFCDNNCVWTDHHPDCKLSQPEQEPDRTGMIYYKNNLCKAKDAHSYDCICWTKAQPEQEPVAWRAWFDADNSAKWLFTLWPEEEHPSFDWQPLYTTPPQPKKPEQDYPENFIHALAFHTVISDLDPEQEQGEPVAVVTGVYGGRFIVEPANSAMVLPVNMALYAHPQPRKPLTRGQIREIEVDVSLNPSFDYITPAEQLCRAIEAAHGIKE